MTEGRKPLNITWTIEATTVEAWGFFSKLATSALKPTNAYVYQLLGILLAGVVMTFLVKFQPAGKPVGIVFALATGVVATVAAYFFFSAIAQGRSTVVVTVSALYPLVTLLLSYFFLHETLSLKQVLGIGLALAAILLLSTK